MALQAFVFICLFAAGCFLSVARHPIFGLLTYIGVFYLHPPSRWWSSDLPELRWSLIASAVTVLSIVIRKPQRLQEARESQATLFTGLIVLLAWLCAQYGWSYEKDMQSELIGLYAKYLILVIVMVKCLDSFENLKMFLGAHVFGCFYLGWIVFTEYKGGRFEGFGGPGINEANAGALQMLTGVFVAAGLFLSGKALRRGVLLALIPFIANGLVAAVSRSGFLAALAGGLVFNIGAPARQRLRVVVLSVLAVVMFLMLTNDTYWERVTSLKYAGEVVEGVDTGAGRLDLMRAQLSMFSTHPAGCGHRCTVTLSPKYLPEEQLTSSSEDGPKGRASHSTPMSLLVEQGVPGMLLYVSLLTWVLVVGIQTKRACDRAGGELPAIATGVLACLAAIFVGDFFVDYLKFETRLWFITVLTVLLAVARRKHQAAASPAAVRELASALPSPAASHKLPANARHTAGPVSMRGRESRNGRSS